MRPTILHVLATAAALVAAAPVFAGEHGRTERVSYADLDLSTETGKAKFERRVAAAVRRVCDNGDGYDLERQMAARRCVGETKARTKGAMLAAIESRSGVRLARAGAPVATVAR